VATPAEIDITTAEELKAVLLEATRVGASQGRGGPDPDRFCDSAGLQALIGAHNRVLAEGRELRLVIRADGSVPRIIALTGLDSFIPCFASLEKALAQAPDRTEPAIQSRRTAAR
jgi:anti-anti-sigma factor